MNKTVLITGASQGIGYEFAKLFARDNYQLVLIGRNKEKLMDIVKELKEQYKLSVFIIVRDLAKIDSSQEIYQYIKKQKLSIDILVNNAGFATYGEFIENSLDEESEEIQVNITTLTMLTKLIVKDMVEKGRGKVLNVASTAAFVPGPLMAVYYASKAYVLSFSQALNEELRGSGVTVSALCPGPTITGFTKRAKMERSKLFKSHVMQASDVARIGYDGLFKGKVIIIPGIRNRLGVSAVKFIPRKVVGRIVKRMQEIT